MSFRKLARTRSSDEETSLVIRESILIAGIRLEVLNDRYGSKVGFLCQVLDVFPMLPGTVKTLPHLGHWGISITISNLDRELLIVWLANKYLGVSV